MPNNRGGKNYKKQKKNPEQDKQEKTPFAEKENMSYAQVLNRLGGDRLLIKLLDNKECQAIIPGRFYKKVWFNKDDIVLITISEYNKKDIYIEHKYNHQDIRLLKSRKLINFESSNIMNDMEDIIDVDFTDNMIDDEESNNEMKDIDEDIRLEDL